MQHGDVDARTRFRRLARRHPLEHAAHTVHVGEVLVAELDDEVAPVLLRDVALVAKAVQRLSDRRPAHPQTVDEVKLVEDGTGRQRAGLDVLP
jgi:hypothetical protein